MPLRNSLRKRGKGDSISERKENQDTSTIVTERRSTDGGKKKPLAEENCSFLGKGGGKIFGRYPLKKGEKNEKSGERLAHNFKGGEGKSNMHQQTVEGKEGH